jgi:hypothetical protein
MNWLTSEMVKAEMLMMMSQKREPINPTNSQVFSEQRRGDDDGP